jgi:hypothetical protein
MLAERVAEPEEIAATVAAIAHPQRFGDTTGQVFARTAGWTSTNSGPSLAFGPCASADFDGPLAQPAFTGSLPRSSAAITFAKRSAISGWNSGCVNT